LTFYEFIIYGQFYSFSLMPACRQVLFSFAKVMEHYPSYYILITSPSPSPLPRLRGEDKGLPSPPTTGERIYSCNLNLNLCPLSPDYGGEDKGEGA